ncbi:MAG: peptide ABC transporter substrate-binding protein [Bacillota bacterium]
MKKLLALSILVIFLAVMLSGCSFSKSDKVILRWAIPDDPESLNPQKMASTYTLSVADQLYEGLTSVAKDNVIVPAGAEKWDVSADRLTYKFYLRKDAKWSNGAPVVAEDYVYSWSCGVDPKYASESAYMLYFIKNGERFNQGKCNVTEFGVKALDQYTLEVKLEHPCEFFLHLTAFHAYFPINKKNAESNSNWAGSANTISCNGPFKIISWDRNSKMVLLKNEYYWDKAKVKLSEIDVYMVDKDSTAMSMMENGQLDISDTLPPDTEYKRLIDAGKLKFYPFMNTNYLAFNVHKKPLNDARVRRALSYSIDGAALLQDAKASGASKEANAWVPYGIPDAAADSDFRVTGGALFKYDPMLAKKLLAEAGYPDGKDFPELTFLFGSSAGKSKYGEMIQEMYKKTLGIKVKLVGQEWKVYNKSRDDLQFDICTNSWVGDYLDPMTYMSVLLTSSDTNNIPRWSNAKYDSLILKAQDTIDNDERMKLMHAGEKIIFEDMPIMPYAFSMNRVMDSGSVRNVIRDASGKTLMKEAYKE